MKKVTIENEEIIEMVKNYPTPYTGIVNKNKQTENFFNVNSGYFAEKMINTLEVMYRWTKEELKKHFTFEEVWCIYRALNSTLYNPTSIKPKEFLIMEIEDYFHYEDHDEYTIEGIKTVFDKIKGLSQFQSYVLLMLYYEFEECREGIFISYEEIKKAFLIEE